jgi:hypothetical protein
MGAHRQRTEPAAALPAHPLFAIKKVGLILTSAPSLTSAAIFTDCSFAGNTAAGYPEPLQGYTGGAVGVEGSVTPTSCTFAGGTGSHTDSLAIWETTTFTCPTASTGAPVVITTQEELEASQLPPAKELVRCTPKLPQWRVRIPERREMV